MPVLQFEAASIVDFAQGFVSEAPNHQSRVALKLVALVERWYLAAGSSPTALNPAQLRKISWRYLFWPGDVNVVSVAKAAVCAM